MWGPFNAGPDKQWWWYERLVAAYRQRCPGPLTERLARAVDGLVDSIDSLAVSAR